MHFKNDGLRRSLYGSMQNFRGTDAISFDINLTDAPRDSMVIVTPFAKDEKAFYYNQKINCLRAEGRALFAGREYLFSPATSFAVLDWGRGVWTYENTWYWGSPPASRRGGVSASTSATALAIPARPVRTWYLWTASRTSYRR